MKYEKPATTVLSFLLETYVLTASDIGGPGATDVGPPAIIPNPTVEGNCKSSVWDEEEGEDYYVFYDLH